MSSTQRVKTLFFLLTLSIPTLAINTPAASEEATIEMAEKVCQTQITIMNQTRKERPSGKHLEKYSLINILEILDESGREVIAYIANLAPLGYIAISADTDIRPVIAYSYNNNFNPQDSSQNTFLVLLRKDMEHRLDALPFMTRGYFSGNNNLWTDYIDQRYGSLGNMIMAAQWPKDREDGWLATNWGQGNRISPENFYNDSCPDDPKTSPGVWTDDGRCITGCIATAIGQILNYWKSPKSITFTGFDDYWSICDPGDWWGTREIFITAADANIGNINYNNGTPSRQTIAALLFACGVAAHMQYSDYGSYGYAGDVTHALSSHFGYSPAYLKSPGGYDQFYTDLCNNMKDAVPSILLITKNGIYGHAIICDGYKSSGEYHLNFGWSGSCNGWYFLPVGMPVGYNTVYRGVLDVYPQKGIVLTSPGGGETWEVGSQHNITWTSIGITNVKIQYSVDGGSNWQTIISETPASAGSYSWKVPYIPTEEALVRVINLQKIDDISIYDQTDSAFSIIKTKTTWYLAEGCTDGFSQWILIQNPDRTPAECRITFMKSDGATVVHNVKVPATSRRTINVNDYVPDESVSAMIESTNRVGIIVERAMYWDAGGQPRAGGHNSCGVTDTSTTWYLAEGCTAGFSEWVLIMNPGNQPAEVTVTFMPEDGKTVRRYITVAPTSRYTIHVNKVIPDSSVSTRIESTNGVGIIAERAMYWASGGEPWAGGHNSCGVTDTSTTWYLAEGATTGSFDEWILIMNPDTQPADIKVTFMKQDGSTVRRDITVGPTSRYTIHVNDILPNQSVSAMIESTNGIGIIAERSMYWDVLGPETEWGTETVRTISGNTGNGDGTIAYRHSTKRLSGCSNLWIGDEYTYWGETGYGFVGFDLTSIQSVTSAKLRVYQEYVHGTPYTDLGGGILVDHVNYGTELDINDYSNYTGTVLAGNIGTISGNHSPGWKELDVTSQVQADITAGRNTSQFALHFPAETDNDRQPDAVILGAAETDTAGDTQPQLAIDGYIKVRQRYADGHNSCGVTAPAFTWYLAEGCTAGFSEWILVMNPCSQPASVRVTFMTEDGTTIQRDITVGPTSRYTIHVNDIVPDKSVSTKVESTNGIKIIAERAMYWDVGEYTWAGGHNSCGIKK